MCLNVAYQFTAAVCVWETYSWYISLHRQKIEEGKYLNCEYGVNLCGREHQHPQREQHLKICFNYTCKYKELIHYTSTGSPLQNHFLLLRANSILFARSKEANGTNPVYCTLLSALWKIVYWWINSYNIIKHWQFACCLQKNKKIKNKISIKFLAQQWCGFKSELQRTTKKKNNIFAIPFVVNR